jgi:hypothetical protein
MRTNLKRGLVVAGVTTLLAGTWTALPSAGEAGSAAEDASASARQVVHVSGRQIPINQNNTVFAMRGDLRGKWSVVTDKTLHHSPTLIIESGTERFRGCLDQGHDNSCQSGEPSGDLRFAFLYWASYDKQGNLIRGQCVHPVYGGTGAFAGARGVVRMFDQPVGGGVRTTYLGTLVLQGTGGRAAAASPAVVAPASRASAASTRLAC